MSLALDADMAVNQASSQDLLARRQQMESLSGSKYSDEERSARLQDACEGFEAVFIQKMWEQMRATLPQDGFLSSKEEKFWQGMYDQELGKSMASSGGIGLAGMMMQQLDRNNQNISEATRQSTSRIPMLNVPPAPLLEQSGKGGLAMAPASASSPAASAASASSGSSARPLASMPGNGLGIYEGEAEQPSVADRAGEAAMAAEAAVPVAPVAPDATPIAVRQTLDELASLGAAQQQAALNLPRQAGPGISTMPPVNVQLQFQRMTGQAPAQSASLRNEPDASAAAAQPTYQAGAPASLAAPALLAEAPEVSGDVFEDADQPVITHITYQTNLPPSQRRMSPLQNASSALSGAPRPRTPLSSATPLADPASYANTAQTAAAISPGVPPGAGHAVNAPVAEPAAPVLAEAPEQRPVDILAGIRPRFVPDRFQQRAVQYDSATAAQNGFTLNAVSRPVQAGGPSFSGPQPVASSSVSLGNPAPPKGSLISPLSGDVNARISSGFGWRLDPFTGQRAWHAGVDIKAEPGEAVLAAMDGVVTFAGQDPELGNMIVVDHGDDLRTLYGHNQGFSVEVGQKVSSGTEIAKAGSSGRAAGVHVHFEARRGDLALNPEPLMRQRDMQMAASR